MEKLLDRLFFLTEELNTILQGEYNLEDDKLNKMTIEQAMILSEIANEVAKVCETGNVEKIMGVQKILEKYTLRINIDNTNESDSLYEYVLRALFDFHTVIFKTLFHLNRQQNEK